MSVCLAFSPDHGNSSFFCPTIRVFFCRFLCSFTVASVKVVLMPRKKQRVNMDLSCPKRPSPIERITLLQLQDRKPGFTRKIHRWGHQVGGRSKMEKSLGLSCCSQHMVAAGLSQLEAGCLNLSIYSKSQEGARSDTEVDSKPLLKGLERQPA